MRKKRVWSPNKYLAHAIRRIWRWNPDRQKIKRATTKCNVCSKLLTPKTVKVDHREPVGSVPKGLTGWDAYLQRMFCPISNLQGLCVSCHQSKTNEERKQRKVLKNGI